MFWGGHTRTITFSGFLVCSLFFPGYALYSCIALHVSSLIRPLIPSSFLSHELCVALGRALLVLFSRHALCSLRHLRAILFSCPLPLRTHFLFVWGTHSSSPSYACTLPPSRSLFPCSPRSRTPMFMRVVLRHSFLFIVTSFASYYLCSHDACYLPIYPVWSWTPCTWRRPRVSVRT